MIRSPARASQSLLALGACVAFLCGAIPALAQAPQVVATYPPNGADHVAINTVFVFVFDRPTGKSVAYSWAVDPLEPGGHLISTAPNRWSPLGDTLYVTPLDPLELGHQYGMKINSLADTSGTVYSNPTYYPEIYFFSTAYQARVERIQARNVDIGLTPDVTTPVTIPVRELAGTAVQFTSVRVQFLPSPLVADSTQPLDAVVTPIYEYTVPTGIVLPRSGVAGLTAPVNLPGSIARDLPQGRLGVRLTFYGTDETSNAVLVDAVFRVDPATQSVHGASVLPAIASDLLVRSAVMEWPLHGTIIAAGDTVLPRVVVTGNGTGAFRGMFFMDGEPVGIEEGYMEAGRPVTVTMRGPLPTRRLGEHRIQFTVESPQEVAANPVSVICVPPPNGVAPPKPDLFKEGEHPAVTAPKLHGAVSWLAEGRTKFRTEDHSAVGWGGWNGAYELGPTRRIEAEASVRLRFDELGNGSGQPQRVLVRYTDPRRMLAYGDAAPISASETPILMSPVPRRSAQATWSGTPLGTIEGYAAFSSRPISVGGEARQVSDLYAAKLRHGFGANDRVLATLYGGYTHEKPRPFAEIFPLFPPDTASSIVERKLIYGGLAQARLTGTWTFLADVATVHHRAPEGLDAVGRSRTGWRSEIRGTAAGFTALAQAFSYQPDMRTALNPYALEDRRGGFGQLERSFLKWHFTGSFRSEEPTHIEGQEPVVRVQTATLSTRVEMNQDSWVTPYYVHVRHKGANTNLVEDRIGGNYTVSEVLGGRTTARFDATFLDDDLRAGTKRRIVSGSLVTTRKHPGRIVSTLAVGFEQNHASDLDRTDTTVQGSFEARWEAIAGRFLVTPYVSGATRHYELLGSKEDRFSARLQLALLRVAGLGENAVSLEGRVDRIQHLTPSRPKDLDGSVQLTVGQRFTVPGL